MRQFKKRERDALDAVARRFSVTWEQGGDPPDAFITTSGRRVAVDIATLKRRGTDQRRAAKPRLRLDKVVTRLMGRLQATLATTVPDGMTVLLTIAAPIRVPSQTAASLEDRIQARLRSRSPGRDEKATIHGNRVQMRVVRGESPRAPPLIGLVHNPDSDSHLLLNLASELLPLAGAEADRRAARLVGERWLVVISARSSSCSEAYRYIYAQLRTRTPFKKTLMVFADGHVEMLAE